jgi:hypothetical protein
MFIFCCAKNRNDDPEDVLGDLQQKLQATKQILIEFTNEEQKLGMKEI